MSENFDIMKKMFNNKNDDASIDNESITSDTNSQPNENIEINSIEENISSGIDTEQEEINTDSNNEINDTVEENTTEETEETENIKDKTTSLEDSSEETESYKICPNCNNQCGVDDAFCNKCGQKLDIETKCPNCGADFSDEDLFCKKCGTELPKIPQKITVTKFCCPTCGTEYSKGDVFCAECGTNLQTNEAFVAKHQNSQPCTPSNTSPNNQHNNQSNYDTSNDIDTVKCPYCGSKVQRYTKKCPHCGEWLSGVSHFGCGSLMMLISTIIAIAMAVGGESVSIPVVGEVAGIWLVITVFLYFLPSLISDWRGHDSKLAIFIVNLLFGWTLIGWFAALIFSFTGRSR